MAGRVLLARHGESDYSARGLINGDASVECGLTRQGMDEARALGRDLSDTELDLSITSGFRRTQETAEVALAGRGVPIEVMEAFNDPPAGDLEGSTVAEHGAWMDANDWATRPPGDGESQLESVARYLRAYEAVVERPDGTILVIAHAFPISVGLTLVRERSPYLRRRYSIPVEHAVAHPVSVPELRDALGILRAELDRVAPALLSS